MPLFRLRQFARQFQGISEYLWRRGPVSRRSSRGVLTAIAPSTSGIDMNSRTRPVSGTPEPASAGEIPGASNPAITGARRHIRRRRKVSRRHDRHGRYISGNRSGRNVITGSDRDSDADSDRDARAGEESRTGEKNTQNEFRFHDVPREEQKQGARQRPTP